MNITPWKKPLALRPDRDSNALELDTNTRSIITWGMMIVLIGIGGFFVWAMFAPLDEGVVTQGVVNVKYKRKTVQHLHGGIIDKILVHEGDKVIKDQPLIQLNETQLIKTKLSLEEQIRGLQESADGQAHQMSLINEELDSLRKLFKEGYVPSNRLFDLERALAELSGARGQNLANIGAYKERLAATVDDIERSTIRSPADGVVLGLNVHTVGGVVEPGERLMDIVPENEPLIIDTTVPTNVIDRVHVGLMADVRFVALNRFTTPTVDGKVINVSADTFSDQRTGARFYTAEVSVPEESMKKLGGQAVQPGMPVDVIIKTGERTFMDYLIKPLLDRLARSLKEE